MRNLLKTATQTNSAVNSDFEATEAEIDGLKWTKSRNRETFRRTWSRRRLSYHHEKRCAVADHIEDTEEHNTFLNNRLWEISCLYSVIIL